MFVLDTNTVIYFFKGLGRVTEHFQQTTPNEVALPAIVLYELEVGIANRSIRSSADSNSDACSRP